eukprot:7614972-Pyramimonas_sp.AAC.1
MGWSGCAKRKQFPAERPEAGWPPSDPRQRPARGPPRRAARTRRSPNGWRRWRPLWGTTRNHNRT